MVAEKIAEAIHNASSTKVPATLRFEAVPIPSSTWQRSNESFAANFVDLERIRDARGDGRADKDIHRWTLRWISVLTGRG